MNAKRRRWLEFHDQKTGGIMGLLPLIKGLPVRLTDHIDRSLGLYKQTKCTIHGWTLNVNEACTLLVSRTHLVSIVCVCFARLAGTAFVSCSVESLTASVICPSPHAVPNQLCCGTFGELLQPDTRALFCRTRSTVVQTMAHEKNSIQRPGVCREWSRASVGVAA